MFGRFLVERRFAISIGILVATVPLICLVLFVKFSLINDLERTSIQQRETYAVAAAQILEDRLRAEIAFGNAVVSRRSLRKAVSTINQPELEYHLKDLMELSHSMERAYIASADGTMLAAYPPDKSIIGKDFSHRDWFKETSRNGKPYVSEFFLRAVKPQRYIFTITLPIRSEVGDRAGILVLEPRSDFIKSAFEVIKTGGSGSIYVVDKRGFLVFHQHRIVDKLMDYSYVPAVAKVIRGLDGAETSFNPVSNTLSVAAYHPIAQSRWGVVTEQPLQEILAPLNHVARGLYLFVGAMVLLAGYNGYKWAGMLSDSQKNAEKLQDRSKQLEDANSRLQEQSLKLVAQAEELEMQSEELQSQNEELQAQGEELEMQTEQLQSRNEELESMRSMLALYNEQLEQKVKERTSALSEEIGQHRKTEVELRESEERYRSLIENIHLGIAVINDDYRILMTNSAMGIMFDKPENDLSHRFCFQEFGQRSTICPHCPGQIAMETGKPTVAEMELVRDLGNRIAVRIQAFPVIGPDGKATKFIAIIQDITEQKQAAEENKRLELQLQQSQKMEAIGTMAGGIAHDFNNVLTVIMGYGRMMTINSSLSEQQKEYVEQIIAAAEKAARLTHGLLAFSRKQVMNPRPANLVEIVQRVQKFLARIIGEDIQLKSITSQAVLGVYVDSGQIEQVLINLATNARDAMRKGGLLTIETGLQMTDASVARTRGFGESVHYAVISVSDNGIGMDEDTCKRIFEPFFTTKELGKGTGLGMAIVYGIVKQHNGFINVYSEPGTGTTFRIYLPIIEGEHEPDEKLAVPALPQGGTETILVAEDESDVRTLMETVLTKFGYQVILAVDGQDAIEKFEANRDKVKLVLMDMIMPRKSGKEAYEAIRRLQADARVLYSSGYTMDFIQSRGELDDETDLILKPVQPMELLKKVREMLDK